MLVLCLSTYYYVFGEDNHIQPDLDLLGLCSGERVSLKLSIILPWAQYTAVNRSLTVLRIVLSFVILAVIVFSLYDVRSQFTGMLGGIGFCSVRRGR